MMNQVVLVGRLLQAKNNIVTIAIKKSKIEFDRDGYDEEVVPIYVDDSLCIKIQEYLTVGDMIGIRGRINKRDGKRGIRIIADKISFLSKNMEDKSNE